MNRITLSILLAAVLLSATSEYGQAEEGKHLNPLQVISGRSYHTIPKTKTRRSVRVGRHFSPMEVMNGRIIVREKRSSQQQNVASASTTTQTEPSKKRVIQLNIKPASHKNSRTPQDDIIVTISQLNSSNADTTITADTKVSQQVIERMLLPPPIHRKANNSSVALQHHNTKKNVPIVVSEPNSEMPTGQYLKKLLTEIKDTNTTTVPAVSPQKAYHMPKTKTLYLTFDDGPINGTKNVLRIVSEENVKATMFYIGREVVHSPALFRQALSLPNVLVANHTYTHANNHYRRFYNGSIASVVADIDKAQSVIGGAKYLRLCGRNVWRLPAVKKNDWGISVAQRGREIGKYDALHRRGYFIYGWDAEWPFSYKTQRPLLSGKEMARRVNLVYRSHRTVKPGSVIVLAHDFMFRTAYNARQLRIFIRTMKAQGWTFRTIDAYVGTFTPDAYIVHQKTTHPDQLKSAQKAAKQAQVMVTVPTNKPEWVTPSKQNPAQSKQRNDTIDIATQLCLAIEHQSFLLVRQLLARGVDINEKNPEGKLPLNVAIQTNNAAMVRMLVERGAMIFNLDANGMSPMGVARQQNSTIIIRYLKKEIAKQQEQRLRQTVFDSLESIAN